MKAKDGKMARFQRRRTLRLSAEEDARLERQAAVAGISVSEYMRRLFFGGRPVIARTDDRMIRELRRMGGLLKHNFDAVRMAGGGSVPAQMEATLEQIRQAIDRLGRQA
ncbi:MAG: hypothetical protein LBB60_03640 [Desulfovibrio sp.]|jgi:hypothetical protein|nr:hypothetical protein [Desulfovibrio sp.]